MRPSDIKSLHPTSSRSGRPWTDDARDDDEPHALRRDQPFARPGRLHERERGFPDAGPRMNPRAPMHPFDPRAGRDAPRRAFGPGGEWDDPSRSPMRRDHGWRIRDDYRYGSDYYGGDLGDEDRFDHDEQDLWTRGVDRRDLGGWSDDRRPRGPGMIGAGGYSGFQSPDFQPGTRWQGPEPRQLRGRYFGRGPRNYRRSDERVSEDIHERLTAHPEIDATDVEIEVQGGVVTVTGAVEDRWTRHRVEDVIDEILGVREIDNRLRIDRGAP